MSEPSTGLYLATAFGTLALLGGYRWSSHPEELRQSASNIIPDTTPSSAEPDRPPTPSAYNASPGATAPPAQQNPPPQAPPPPPPPPPPEVVAPSTCHQTGGPFEIARTAEGDIGTFLRTDGARVAVAWVVPARRSPGPDDVSVAWLNADASFREWVIEGHPSRQRDAQRSTLSLMRVLPTIASGSISPRIDRRYLNPSGQWVIECGDVANVFASPVQTDPTLPPVLASDWNAMYWCRSADVIEPFVIAARTAVDGAGSLTGEARLFATRTPGAPLPARYWTLRFNQGHVLSAREPSDKLREVAGPAKLSVAATPQGYAVSFLHRSRLQFGWLDRDLNPVGALTQLPTLGATPGRATMRWNGSELVMVFADRAESSERYTLRAARIAFGQSPQSSSFFAISASADLTQHEIAPELTRLDDGTFLLTWTQGAESARQGLQSILVRRYAADLSPRGGPLYVLGSASDSEVIAVNGNNVVLVALSGSSGVRTVQSIAIHCDP